MLTAIRSFFNNKVEGELSPVRLRVSDNFSSEADLRSESDIRSLTGAESCHQLLSEQKDLSFEMIQKKNSLVQLLKQIKDISADVKDALTDNGVLVDNLSILKDMKTHMKDMQSVLDDHICSLEANIQNQPNQESVTNVTKSRHDNCPEGAHGELKYQMVVDGTTFGAHDQLMEKVKKEVQDQFDLVQSNSDDYGVTIVFCPIVSRMGPDIESALRDVKGDKPVILVLMHHAYEAKFIPNVQQGANVQLQVNVFFHKTKHGLLHCEENTAAVCNIKNKIQECTISKALVVAAAAGNTGTLAAIPHMVVAVVYHYLLDWFK